MKILISLENVSRNFIPHKSALAKLVEAVQTHYRHQEVEFLFEIATTFKATSTGSIVPDKPVSVYVVVVDSYRFKDTNYVLPKDFSSQAESVNRKIQDLLIFSKPEEQNLPATVRIIAGGNIYKFLGTEPLK